MNYLSWKMRVRRMVLFTREKMQGAWEIWRRSASTPQKILVHMEMVVVSQQMMLVFIRKCFF